VTDKLILRDFQIKFVTPVASLVILYVIMAGLVVDLGETDDAVLVRAVQEGEIECFEPLVDRHLAFVRTFLSLKAPAARLIDEIAHDTFVFAHQHLSEFQAGTSFRSWLRAIAWNLLRAEVLRFSRSEARSKRLEELWLAESEGHNAPASADSEYLEECLSQLPADSKKLLELHYTEGIDSTGIAANLSRSRAWVRTTLFRIRQQLKSCINGKRAAELNESHA
jgi:RNA polymerase sigma-70 factor (ECF subfamily)